MFIFMLTNTLFYTLSCTQYFKTKDILYVNLKPKAQGYNYKQKKCIYTSIIFTRKL